MENKLRKLEGDKDRPPRIQPKVKSAPKVRQLYWCDFPEDAHLPEFWKQRPVIILSHNNNLYGAVTVVACSSKEQKGNKWSIKLDRTIDGKDSWAICDKPTTVAVSRLSPGGRTIQRISEKNFRDILTLVLDRIPKLK